MKKIKILELFGGIGAPRKALENIGYDVKSIDYVEVLSYAVEAYNQIFDNNYKQQDVLDWNLHVDVLIHGSPCQDFSNAGKNDLSTGRSILYNRTLEIIKKELNPKPKVVIWENVPGLLSKKHVKYFNHYIDQMKKMGYDSSFEILDSLDFGIPQKRRRIYVVSILKAYNIHFDFNLLERKKTQPLAKYLNRKKVFGYDVIQPSMIKSLKNGSSFIAESYVNTITTATVRWNTCVVYKEYPKTYYDFVNNKTNGCIKLDKISKLKDDEHFYEKFRYLTEKEEFLLMGFSEKDFLNITKKVKQKSHLQRLAGNSIVVPVLEAIFKVLRNMEVI